MRNAINPLCWWGIAIFWGGGFLFKVMHWPLASFNLLMGTVLLLIATPLRARASGTFDVHALLVRATIATAHAFILFRLQFWAGALWVLLVHVLVLAALFAAFLRNQFQRPVSSGAALCVGLISTALYFVPSYSISYAFGVGSPLHRDMRPYSYIGWCQYSWFLYQAGENERSLAAMDSTLTAAQRCVNERSYNPALVVFYQEERDQIVARTWSSYRWPPDEYSWWTPPPQQ